MRYGLIFSFLLLLFHDGYGQNWLDSDKNIRKGKIYVFWGWNWSVYSKSDLHFKGSDYDFTLKNVKSSDRQSPFSLNTYFNPSKFTIPQYNFRLGYYLKEHWDISFGIDHMKY
ncbi:MAG: hypothetical protein WAT79_01065, partial [Saprospiraceae bacterium]